MINYLLLIKNINEEIYSILRVKKNFIEKEYKSSFARQFLIIDVNQSSLYLFTPAISSAISPNNTQETKKHSQIAIKLNQNPSTCIKSGQNKYIPPNNSKNKVLKQPKL